MDNNDVAQQVNSSILLGLCIWAENLERKGKIWAFAPKPNISVNLEYVLSLKKCGRIFIFLLD